MARRGASRRRRKGSRLARALALLLVAAAAGGAGFLAWPTVAAGIAPPPNYRAVERHAPILRVAAREARIDPNLLAAVVLAESSGRPGAVSPAGALGLCQLMLPTAVERARLLGLPEPTREDLLRDAALNARLGASYLRWLLVRYRGDVERALIAYNAGPGRLERWIDEAGGYDPWRSARAAKRSPVLAYALRVQAYRDEFARRGQIVPSFAVPAPSERSLAPPLYGPPSPPSGSTGPAGAPGPRSR